MKHYIVDDVMTKRDDIVMISSYAPMRELLQLMKEKNVKSVIVDRSGPHDAYGIVTYTNILQAMFSEDGDIDLINVYDICTKPLIQVVSQLHIKYAAQLMVKQGVTRLSVTWEGGLVGIVTMTDIVKTLMDEAHRELEE